MSNERTGDGVVKLSVSAWALLWSVFVVVVAGLGFVVRLDSKVEVLMKQQNVDHDIVTRHVSEPGHAVAMEKTRTALERIEKLENRKP